jgi:hypothetical protein
MVTKTKPESTELVPTSVDLTKLPAAIQAAINEMSEQDGEFDPERMILDIMEATSLDDILESTAVHLKDIIGVPFTINSAKLQDSDYDESTLPKYAVIFATLDDGENIVITTGAATVVAQVVKAHMMKGFPWRVSSSLATSSRGYDVIKLRKAPPLD